MVTLKNKDNGKMTFILENEQMQKTLQNLNLLLQLRAFEF